MIHRYVVLGNEEAIIEELVPVVEKDKDEGRKCLPSSPITRPSLKEIQHVATLEAESAVIYKVLNQTNWNRKKSSELLNISYKALLYKIKECGIYKR